MKLKYIAVLALLSGLETLHAQDAISASGGEAWSSGGSVSYSVGQVFYAISLSVNGSIVQGVQQPYEMFFVPAKADSSLLNIACSIYPNPVTDNLTIKVENYKGIGLSYQLYESNGTQIEEKSINNSLTSISMDLLVPAIYFLKIMIPDQEIRTLKIVKLKM